MITYIINKENYVLAMEIYIISAGIEINEMSLSQRKIIHGVDC